jgi:hypothetical protein
MESGDVEFADRWEALTPKEKRIRVALASGEWKIPTITEGPNAGKTLENFIDGPNGEIALLNHLDQEDCPLPDYLNDFNAMFRLEKLIPYDMRRDYAWSLAGMWESLWADSSDVDKAEMYWAASHCDAAERAAAFVQIMERAAGK